MFAILGQLVCDFGWMFAILVEVLLSHAQEDIQYFGGGGQKGTKTENIHFVYKLISPREDEVDAA